MTNVCLSGAKALSRTGVGSKSIVAFAGVQPHAGVQFKGSSNVFFSLAAGAATVGASTAASSAATAIVQKMSVVKNIHTCEFYK